jgi:Ca2+-binding RTX toxin-like protein
MSRSRPTQFIALESRRLLSGLPIDIPGLVDPSDIDNFNGVRIDASQFPAQPVTVQVTSTGPVVALPMLRGGVVTGSGTAGADQLTISTRVGVDRTSTLPGIVFFDGAEATDPGVQIFGSVAEAVAAFSEVGDSLNSALAGLQSTRDSLAAMGLPTDALDQQIAEFRATIQGVLQTLDQTLTSSFVRVTLAGQYDAYFLSSKVTDVQVAALAGNDVVNSTTTGRQRLVIDGGAGNDVLTASGRATLRGGTGNDRLVAGAASWMEGNAGNDTLIGSVQVDSLFGGEGDDVLDAGSTNSIMRDIMDGGTGRDRMIRGGLGARITSVELRK